MLKRQVNLQRRVLSFGEDFIIKNIDYEDCGYYVINASYDIEISGLCNNRLDSKLEGYIYIWFNRQIVEKLPFVTLKEAKSLLKELLNHYDKEILDKQKVKWGIFEKSNETPYYR